MEDEHEVYGGDIPDEVEGEIEADTDGEPDDLVLKGDDTTTDEAASKVSAPLPFPLFCWLLNGWLDVRQLPVNVLCLCVAVNFKQRLCEELTALC